MIVELLVCDRHWGHNCKQDKQGRCLPGILGKNTIQQGIPNVLSVMKRYCILSSLLAFNPMVLKVESPDQQQQIHWGVC